MQPTRSLFSPLAMLALLTAGCTTAGPFVTSISSDGRGGVIVEKSMVKYNSFMGTVSNEHTTSTTINSIDTRKLDNTAASKPQECWTGESD
ncbi:MAG: hypothetical protein CMJ84_09335 [Planctomycetes bacterium]|jgi:type IV secretion system protein VirB7|nr:hypothetical protein [Planctomycetota bacterium]MDP6407872.1 hypothetical protein [Planctomycetota bacterium]